MAKRKNNIDDIDIVDDFELEDIDDFDPLMAEMSLKRLTSLYNATIL